MLYRSAKIENYLNKEKGIKQRATMLHSII